MIVHALTSSRLRHETLNLFLTRDTAHAELREILEDEPLERSAARRANRTRRAERVGETMKLAALGSSGSADGAKRFARRARS
jgi:hypothetical protein